MVPGAGERRAMRGGERVAQMPLDLRPESVHAHALDGVFQPGVLADASVAMVALRPDHRVAYRHRLLRRAEADHVARAREGVGFAMGHAHAAAHRHVVADHRAVPLDADEAQVVREHVHVVLRRHGDGHLELPRQVGGAVQRLFFRLAAGHALLADPQLMPGAGFRQQVVAEPLGQRQSLRVRRAGVRVGGAHDVAVHVAASRDGVEQRVVHGGQRRAQVALDDAVELDRLPGGEADGAVGPLPRDLVQLQPLLGADAPAGDAEAGHEADGRLHALAPALRSQVAVVLLVEAVELRQLRVVLGQSAGDDVAHAFGDGAAERAAAGLDALVL